MAFVDTLSDAEIDTILERFDLTEPKLQRRIVAEAIWQQRTRHELLAALKRLTNHPLFDSLAEGDDADLDAANAAIEKAEETA